MTYQLKPGYNPLPLFLFMFRIVTNYRYTAFSFNDFTMFAYRFYGWSDFHVKSSLLLPIFTIKNHKEEELPKYFLFLHGLSKTLQIVISSYHFLRREAFWTAGLEQFGNDCQRYIIYNGK